MDHRIVPGKKIIFKDDIEIDESAINQHFALPALPIFSAGEMQVIYNGHIFVARDSKVKDAFVKVHTMTFSLEESLTPKEVEDNYLSTNSVEINRLKEDFIKNCIKFDNTNLSSLSGQVGKLLAEKVYKACGKVPEKNYSSPPGKGNISKLEDNSVFNSHINNCERVLLLDNKVYFLETFPEYLSRFENSFEPQFYKQLKKQSESASPEDIHKILTDNRDSMNPKVLPYVRNRIGHNDNSFKLKLDDTYWVPIYKCNTDSIISAYAILLERKIKIDAVSEIGGEK